MEFDSFFTGTYTKTVSTVFAVVGSLADAEDVAQEAYARAARHWRRIQHYEAPEYWVRRVAYNLALSNRRTARRLANGFDAVPEPALHSAPDAAIDLYHALRRLPPRYRAVLALHYLLDLPLKEIAEQLDLPIGTVRTQLDRGRKRLAAELGELSNDRPAGPRGQS